MNNLLDKSVVINLKKESKREYSKFLLEANPFPGTAISRDVPIFNVDRNEIIHHFEEIIIALPDMQTPPVTTIVGQYGDGKTHLLKLFKFSINSQLFDFSNNEKNTIGIYVRTPGKNFLGFFGEVIEDLGRELLHQISKKILWNYIKSNTDKAEQFKIGQYTELTTDSELESYLQDSMVLDLFKNIRQKSFRDIDEPDLIFALLFLYHPDYSGLAWSWLLGGNLNADERKSILVESVLGKDQVYKQYKNLLHVLRVVGIDSTVLLIDELEKIVTIPGLQRAQYHDQLRHMIDDSPGNTAYFFAVAPKQWNQITGEDSALARRLSENIMRLKAFDKNKIQELISEHLKHYRTGSKTDIRHKFSETEPSIAPFTEDAIDEIVEESKGNVFTSIVLARRSLDFALDNPDISNYVNKDVVKKVVDLIKG